MKKFHGLTFLVKILISYLFLIILGYIFYRYNFSIFGSISSEESLELFKGFMLFSTANICYTFGLYAAFTTFPFSYKFYCSRKYQTISMVLYTIGIILITTINLSDAVYFHYAAKRFTATEFFYLEDNNNNTTLVIHFLKENVPLIIAGIAIISVWFYLFIKLDGPHLKFKSTGTHYTIHSIIFAIIVFFIIIGMRGGFDRQTRPITISNAAQYTSTPEKGALVLSNPFCILRTIENKAISCPKYFEKPELEKVFSSQKEYYGDSLTIKSQKGKNVVIFILESFSAEHSKKLYPELYAHTLTPFMDSLMGEGYLLRKAYANGKKSIDALPSILSSIPSFGVPFATIPEALSKTDALGKLAKNEGYSTWFFNGSERGSMGYVAYSKIAGIDNFRTKEDYELVHGKNDFDGYWGIWDEPFFRYMGETLNTAKSPFISVLFSLSSHHPFVVPEKYRKTLPKGYTKVHQPVAYVDLSLRHFFDFAKTQPWYKNTIFLFVADHVSSEKYSDEAKTSAGSTHITMFYFTPDHSIKGETSKTTQQIDVMPTLASILDFKGPYHCFGHSIFSKSDTTTSFSINYANGEYQWIENDTAYIFNGEKIVACYDLKTDSLQKNNIKPLNSGKIETSVKAFIQTYFSDIKERKFTAK